MKKFSGLLLASTILGASILPSYAFFDTTDKTEAYTILPNESAFWIPDVGDNKTSQSKMDSEAYYAQNKLALKRFVIPHIKLSGSGGTSMFSGWDSYVTAGRLIIVDRTPQSREWVKNVNKGTSEKDESFPCQSKEGLNIGIGVSIGLKVKEDDSPKFLYNFGVNPPTYVGQDGRSYFSDRKDPQTIFTSVYYGRSLSSVTDDFVRKKVQTLMCDEIAKRSFDDDNAQQVEIMAKVRNDTTTFLQDYGISLDFMGYADTWTFDAEVQKAINQKYAASVLGPQMKTLQDLNNLEVQEGLAKGLENHGLPVVIPNNLLDLIKNLAAPH